MAKAWRRLRLPPQPLEKDWPRQLRGLQLMASPGSGAPLQGRQIGEELEGAAGLPLGLAGPVVLAGAVVAPAGDGDHPTVAAVQQHHRPLAHPQRGGSGQATAQLPLHHRLHRRIEVGLHQEIPLSRHIRPQQPLQVKTHLVGVVGRRPPTAAAAGLAPQLNGAAAGAAGLVGAEAAAVGHLQQHHVPGLQGRLGIDAGIMAVGRGQQTHQQGRLLQAELGRRLGEEMAGGVFEAPTHPQIHPVQIAQQQVALAETGLQLQGHQQLPPLADQRLPLAHLLGVEAAGQLLGQGAAPLQHPATEHVGGQGPGGADRIHAGVPPEAAVLTGEQGIHQGRREIGEGIVFAMFARFDGTERPVQAVVEGEGASHRRQAAPHRGPQEGQSQQQQAPRTHARQNQGEAAGEPQSPGHRLALEHQLRQPRLLGGAEAHHIAIPQQQLPDPLAPPEQPVGGAAVTDQPLVAHRFEPGVLLADSRVVEAQLQTRISAEADQPAVERHPAGGLAAQMDLDLSGRRALQLHQPPFQALNGAHGGVPPRGPGSGRPPPR